MIYSVKGAKNIVRKKENLHHSKLDIERVNYFEPFKQFQECEHKLIIRHTVAQRIYMSHAVCKKFN